MQDGKVTALKTTESQNCELSSQTYSVHTVGLYLVLKFENGIVVIWDKNTRVSVILDPHWNVSLSLRQDLCGYKVLCEMRCRGSQVYVTVAGSWGQAFGTVKDLLRE